MTGVNCLLCSWSPSVDGEVDHADAFVDEETFAEECFRFIVSGGLKSKHWPGEQWRGQWKLNSM